MWPKLMRKLVKWVDPKLERYRERAPKLVQEKPKYRPETIEEFIDVVRRTPKSVLSAVERARIAAVMSFDEREVREIMTGRERMVFVRANEVLGPLTLDKLYKSGFTSFPVMDARGKVVGILNTEVLNDLTVREAERAEKYADARVNYVLEGEKVARVAEEMRRTDGDYYLVQNESGEIVGFLTAGMILGYLLGENVV